MGIRNSAADIFVPNLSDLFYYNLQSRFLTDELGLFLSDQKVRAAAVAAWSAAVARVLLLRSYKELQL